MSPPSFSKLNVTTVESFLQFPIVPCAEHTSVLKTKKNNSKQLKIPDFMLKRICVFL